MKSDRDREKKKKMASMSSGLGVSSLDVPTANEPEQYRNTSRGPTVTNPHYPSLTKLLVPPTATSSNTTRRLQERNTPKRRTGKYRSKTAKKHDSKYADALRGSSSLANVARDPASPKSKDGENHSNQQQRHRPRRYRDKINKYDPTIAGQPNDPEENFATVEPSASNSSEGLLWNDVVSPGAVLVSATEEEHPLNKGQLTRHDSVAVQPQRTTSFQRQYQSDFDEYQEEYADGSVSWSWRSFQWNPKNRSKAYLTVFCIMLVIASAAVVAAVTAMSSKSGAASQDGIINPYGSQDSSEQEETPETPPVTIDLIARGGSVRELVLTITDAPLLDHQGSPQNMAFDWIVTQDTLLSLFATDEEKRKLLQRYALAVFYHGTGGDHSWVRDRFWLDPSFDECEWQFITCNQERDVVNINTGRTGNGLTGNIPGEIGALSSIDTLDLPMNSLFHLPWELGRLSNLVFLDVNENALSGTMPSAIYELILLEQLHMRDNGLHGSISPAISKLSNLTRLSLSFNSFSGELPLESLTTISDIDVASNHLQGNMAEIMRTLVSAEMLWLDSNGFVGSIPSEIGLMSNLEYLYLDHTSISSTIPSEIGLVTNLIHLTMTATSLSGLIPKELSMLSHLEILHLSANLFSGVFPQEICTLQQDDGVLEDILVDCNMECSCRSNICREGFS